MDPFANATTGARWRFIRLQWEKAMSSKSPPPNTSRDIDGQAPRKDRDREQEKAVVKDANENEQDARDDIHGDGEKIGLEKE